MKTRIQFIFAAILAGTSFAHAKGDASATLFFVSGSEISKGLFDFLASNELKAPLTIRDVGSDKKAMELSFRKGKECGLTGQMLKAYPLLVVSNHCVVNDRQIMEYMEKNAMISIRKDPPK
jgi:hypothetical protein